MIRKAETLYSPINLNLSDSTLRYIMFKHKASPYELVLEGRQIALELEEYPQRYQTKEKWKRELVDALDAAGFIRHDLYPRTYRVWCFYADSLCCEDFFNPYDTNIRYEETPAVTDEEYYAIIDVFSRLEERQKYLLMAYYGFERDARMGYTELAREIGVTDARIAQILENARRKLRSYSQSYRRYLPSLFGFETVKKESIKYSNGKENPRTHVDGLGLSERTANCLGRAGIETLGQILKYDPAGFVKIHNFGARSAYELADKMKELGYGYRDFTIDCTAWGHLKPDADVSYLGLGVHARRCLDEANICTIQDIIDYPPKDWYKIRGFGIKTAADIEAKMHDAGYLEFNTGRRSGYLEPSADIRYLGLNVRAWKCLMRTNIRTVKDIIDYPPERWSNIRNLGRKTAAEIEASMHEVGYPEFHIKYSQN